MNLCRLSNSCAGFLTAAVVSAFLMTSPAYAKTTVVGTGNPASCTESVLRDALLNPPGGKVSFLCGPQMATIPLTMSIAITADTDVDGDKLITLQGAPAGPLFTVAQGVTLSLSELNLKSGGAGSGNGGAVFNSGTLTLEQVGLISNLAASGGAIYNNGTLIVSDSTFQGNSASSGGAVFNASGAKANFVNSTFSGNAATNGGGLYNDTNGTADFNSVTLYLNTAGAAGKGIYNSASGGAIGVRNTIVAETGGGGVTQCFGAITTNVFNLSSDSSCGFNPALYDQIGVNPQLLPLLPNSGAFTWTHKPSLNNPTSPVINAGDTTNNCPVRDQPGNPRPFGPACDIGAVEEQSPPHKWYVRATDGNDNNSCETKTDPCLTINGAIGKAQAWDEIYVTADVYTSSNPAGVVDVNKNMTISGGDRKST